MNQLIKIENVNGTESVSAKELYDFLELDKSHYSRWVQKNIIGEQFFIEGLDYQGFAIVANGNETMEYAISIDMAKELSMLARNQKGKEARQYFIEAEKRLHKQIPQTYAEALRLCADQVEQIEAQKQELQIAQPKVEFHNAVAQSENTLDMNQVAKLLNNGYGRNNLINKLKELKIFMANGHPYQRYVSAGYFKLVESPYTTPYGKVKVSIKTVAFQRGIEFIMRELSK